MSCLSDSLFLWFCVRVSCVFVSFWFSGFLFFSFCLKTSFLDLCLTFFFLGGFLRFVWMCCDCVLILWICVFLFLFFQMCF